MGCASGDPGETYGSIRLIVCCMCCLQGGCGAHRFIMGVISDLIGVSVSVSVTCDECTMYIHVLCTIHVYQVALSSLQYLN